MRLNSAMNQIQSKFNVFDLLMRVGDELVNKIVYPAGCVVSGFIYIGG